MRPIALALTALVALPASASTVHVPGDQPTIAAALEAALAGDVVEVACGTYFEHDIPLKSGVDLRSVTGDPSCVVIDGGGNRVFYMHYLTEAIELRGLTLENGYAWWGGALDCFTSPAGAVIRDCHFSGNVAAWHDGGAVCAYGTPLEFVDCSFYSNSAFSGGAVAADYASSVRFERCVFWNNQAYLGGALYIYNAEGPALISSCTFYGNGAEEGAAIWAQGVNNVVESSILAFNEGGVPILCDDPVALQCSNLYGNEGGNWVECLAGQLGVDGNFSADPLFCDPEDRNFHIDSHSPCAPPGVTQCGLVGALPVGCGAVSVEEESWGGIKEKYR